MNDANNAGTLLPCPFCGEQANFYENQIDFVPKWSVSCGGCDANMDVCEDEKSGAARAWNTRALATPNAPVEQREAIARIIDPEAYETISEARWEGLARLENQAEAQLRAERKADTILAVRLDEAAIRKDERERCAKV